MLITNQEGLHLQTSPKLYTGSVSRALGRVEQRVTSLCDKCVTTTFSLCGVIGNTKEKRRKNFTARLETEQNELTAKVAELSPRQSDLSEKEGISLKNNQESLERVSAALLKASEKKPHRMRAKLRRVAAIITAPVTLPVLGVGTLLTAPAMLAFRASLQSHKADLVCLEPDINAFHPPILEPGANLKIYTHNIAHSRYDIMNTVNRLDPAKDRINELVEKIISQDNDVICLQEAFHETLVYKKIAKRLKAIGYYVVYAAKPKLGVLSSGLLLASKYPITQTSFMPYEPSTQLHMNYLANKGVLATKLDLGNGHQMTVATTHALSGIPGVGRTDEERRKYKIDKYIGYFHKAREFLKDFSSGSEQIFCGDFNTHYLKRTEDGLFVKDIDKSLNEVAGLMDTLEDLTLFTPMNNIKPLEDDQDVYPTNEIGNSEIRHGTSLERDSPYSYLIGENQNVLDHFFRNTVGAESLFQEEFMLECHEAGVLSRSGHLLSDHCGLTLTLNSK